MVARQYTVRLELSVEVPESCSVSATLSGVPFRPDMNFHIDSSHILIRYIFSDGIDHRNSDSTVSSQRHPNSIDHLKTVGHSPHWITPKI